MSRIDISEIRNLSTPHGLALLLVTLVFPLIDSHYQSRGDGVMNMSDANTLHFYHDPVGLAI